jgi:hypothetical protein
MPTPTIPAGNLFMNATLYTGDGSQTASFTNGAAGASFQPDMVWSKIRTGTTQGTGVFDSVRGTTGQSLDTAATTAEGTWNGAASSDYGYVSAFNSNGFSVNDGAVATTGGYVNYATRTYVAWQWKAGGTAVTNTAGSISSQVSANTTSGFSIVTYTGTGANATVGHGLGVAPSMIIVKKRSGATAWIIGFTYSGFTWTSDYFQFDTSAKRTDGAGNIFSSAPTSTTFAIGSDTSIGANTATYVAYCWTPIAGYSAFGSYTGNGSTDGPFVYLGFRPKFVMFKRTDAVEQWAIRDTARDTYNASELELFPNLSNAEEDNNLGIDLISNGFKIRNSANRYNASGGTYIYMAFAENPFKYSNAR